MTHAALQNNTLPDSYPTPKTLGNRFSNIRRFRRDPIDALMTGREKCGDFVMAPVLNRSVFMLFHPDMIQYVLQTNNQNYRKGRGLMRARPVLGDGLLTNHGESWLSQRRLMQPAFHRQRLSGLAADMNTCIESTLAEWHGRAITGESFDMSAEMMHLTLRIVGQTLFSTDVSGSAETVGEAMDDVLSRSTQRTLRPDFMDRLPLRGNRHFREAVQSLDRIVYHIIQHRRNAEMPYNDLLGMLMAAQDAETGRGMSNKQLRDEVMTIFLAGHETTANALTWTWYLLSQNPDIFEQMRDEQRGLLHGRMPSFDDLEHLPYTRMVIEESIRLYPPAWIIGRMAIADDVIAGYHIPAGAAVLMSPYVMHRHPAYWSEPERFNPHNFTPEKTKERSKYVYFPFGGGPRVCIGNSFAMMEAQLVLATLAQHYYPQHVAGHTVALNPSVTLRPRYGMQMVIKQ